MIKDISIKKIVSNFDDRGFFSEIAKSGEDTFHEIKQTSYAETYPGVIKAFHWHKKQWDLWFIMKGLAQVVLFDLREDSPTKGETMVLYAGENNLNLISIPPGVAHGYRVLGNKPMGILYHTSEAYDPKNPDEERIPYDSSIINFDWKTQNR